jgi:mannose-6-phosphate isomerase-like protein (cupin superfamily)
MTQPEQTQSKRLTISNGFSELMDHDAPFKIMLEHGSLQVEIYKPDQVDLQTPHARDELYVIASGFGTFINGNQRHPFEPGEVLFVPAGVEHRFVDFSDDFATWVFFYGPEGGEAAVSSI